MAKLLAKELDAPEDTMLAAVGEADWQTITEVCGDMDAIKTVYETQQGIFLDNGTITENVPVEDYVLFDVMQEAYDAYSAAKYMTANPAGAPYLAEPRRSLCYALHWRREREIIKN